MPNKATTPVPVNIIAGSLGVGKTTAINSLLARRPEQERWSVLVNEYGLVGIDAALMQDSARRDVEIKEVAGGCICCTAGFLFEMYLVLLLQRKPDRLLIEPTGLAELTGILETLARPGIAESVDLRSIICLLDPRSYEQDLQRPEIRDQLESADVLLGSRFDLASKQENDQFQAWAGELFPPKKHVGLVQRGDIPLELLDLVQQRVQRGNAKDSHGHRHLSHEGHQHTHKPASEPEIPCNEAERLRRFSHVSSAATAYGWTFWEGLTFPAEELRQWLEALSQSGASLRVKAAMRTDQGWQLFNFSGPSLEVRKTGAQRESRLECLFAPKDAPDQACLEAELMNLGTSSS